MAEALFEMGCSYAYNKHLKRERRKKRALSSTMKKETRRPNATQEKVEANSRRGCHYEEGQETNAKSPGTFWVRVVSQKDHDPRAIQVVGG